MAYGIGETGKARCASSLIIALVGLAAARAEAAPATVKVFEAQAREQPADDARVVQVFPERASISVSEDVNAGWRRVRLSDGGVGFIHDAEIKLDAPAPAAAAPGAADPAAPPDAAPAAPPPPARARQVADADRPGVSPAGAPFAARPQAPVQIYVKDLDHLASLVEHDSVVSPMAHDLASRRTSSIGVLGTAVGISVALVAVGLLNKTQDCFGDGSSGLAPTCVDKPRLGFIYAGVAVDLVGTIAWAIMTPKRSDLLDVINTWNRRHPDEPFSIEQTHRSMTF
jgi:hypothetical protein